MNDINNLNVIVLNCKSLDARINELRLLVYYSNPDIICLTETWLNNDKVIKYNYNIHGYKCIFQHRLNRLGGGLVTYIKQELYFIKTSVRNFTDGNLEVQFFDINMKNNRALTIFNYYNPNRDISLTELEYYMQYLKDPFLMVGDLNCHTPLLREGDTTNVTGKNLELFLSRNQICIINPINFFTYIDPRTANKSCLDICLCSPQLIDSTNIKRLNGIGSDHYPLSVTIQQTPTRNIIRKPPKWNLDGVDWKKWTEDIPITNINLDSEVDRLNEDIKQRINFSNNINIKKTYPKDTPRRRTPWFTEECKIAINNRRKALKILEKYPSTENINNYKEQSKIVAAIIKKAKRQSWENYIKTLSSDTPSKEVWSKINSIKNTYKTSIYPIKVNGQLTDNNTLKANKFAEHFQNISTIELVTNIETELYLESKIEACDNMQLNSKFTLYELKGAIKKLKNKTPGFDQIHNIFLKKAPLSLLNDILNLFNKSFTYKTIPSSWKVAVIIPIIKPGKKEDNVKSYRPIALLSCIGKLMEHLIHKRLDWFVQTNSLLHTSQCGFRRGLSTMDVLLRFEHNIRQAQMASEICIIAYMDLSCAFDTVNPLVLLIKLANYNITGNILGWLKSYLVNRAIRVRLGDTYSKTLQTNAGVPQGGILSPLLFNLLLSDIPEDNCVDILSYADDITLMCRDKHPKVAESHMQNYINKLTTWFKKQGLIVNPDKTYFQYFYKKTAEIKIDINNIQIKKVKEHKLLGMIIDMPHLTWKEHLKTIISEGYRRINIMKALSSTSWGASPKILRMFYMAFIRSKLEYGAILFPKISPILKGKMEVLQNACLRLILGACKTTPILSLQVEANILPLDIRFQYVLAKKYLQLCYKYVEDDTSKILNVSSGNSISGIAKTFKYRATSALVNFGRNNWKRITNSKDLLPPWKTIYNFVESEMPENGKTVIENFNFLINNKYKNFHAVYTDGSKLDNGSTSSAVYTEFNKGIYSWKLSCKHSILGAELYAIKMSLIIIKLNIDHYNKIVVFTDSKTAVMLIQSENNNFSQDIPDIKCLLYELNQTNTVMIQWIRSHSGIEGNEVADRAAKAAHQHSECILHPLSYTEDVSLLQSQVELYWKNYWINQAELEQKGLFLINIRCKNLHPRKWVFSRKIETLLTRLRTGHVQLNAYLHRFNLSETDQCSFCQEVESIEHYLLKCYKYSASRMLLEHEINKAGGEMTLSCLLGGDSHGKKQFKILKATVNYIKSTSLYRLL